MIVIVGGAFVLLLALAALAYFMTRAGAEDAPAPSPADALEADLPPPEERSADEESELMQKKQEASADAAAPTPEFPRRGEAPIKDRPRKRRRRPGGHYTGQLEKKRTSGRTSVVRTITSLKSKASSMSTMTMALSTSSEIATRAVSSRQRCTPRVANIRCFTSRTIRANRKTLESLTELTVTSSQDFGPAARGSSTVGPVAPLVG